MQRTYLLLAALVFLATSAFSQPPDTLWTRTYGIEGYQALYDMQVTRDGGFILAGESGNHALLLRAAADGDMLWTRTYDLSSSDWANSVRELPDGGFVVAGYMGCGLLMRTDSLGDTLWVCPLTCAFELFSASCTHDGGFVACGLAINQNDMVVLKTDAFGAMEWSRSCGGLYYDCGFEARELADGSIMAAG